MRSVRWLPGVVLALTLFAGCGSGSTVAFIPAATNTAMPIVTATVDSSFVAKACGSDFPKERPFSQVGDLVLSQPSLQFLTYPGYMLPDNIPSRQPYQVPGLQGITTKNPNLVQANPGFGDSGGSSYGFVICDTSASQSYLLQAGAAQITTVIPDTNTHLNVQIGCDTSFSSKTRSGDGGCGGSISGYVNGFHATWPNTVAAGTTARQVIQTEHEEDFDGSGSGTPVSQVPPLPATLQPGKIYWMYVSMDYPATAGIYTFRFGIHTNNGLALSPTTAPVFLAKNAAQWSGNSCWKNYQSIIPNTGIEKFYLCPGTGY